MRVRIRSGNQAGQVADVPQAEGESLLATGFAERVAEEPPTAAPVLESAPASEPGVPDAPPPLAEDEDEAPVLDGPALVDEAPAEDAGPGPA